MHLVSITWVPNPSINGGYYWDSDGAATVVNGMTAIYTYEEVCEEVTSGGDIGGTGGSGSGSPSGPNNSNNEDVNDFYTFEEIIRICPESIVLKRVGSSYYTCLEDIFALLDTRGGDGVTLNLTYCVSIPVSYGSNYAKQVIAHNLSEAKQRAANFASDLRSAGIKYTGSKVRQDINSSFKNYLADWVPGSSISTTACEGAIPCFYVEKDC